MTTSVRKGPSSARLLEKINREIRLAIEDSKGSSGYYEDAVRRAQGTAARLAAVRRKIKKLPHEWRVHVTGERELADRVVWLRKLMLATPRGRATAQKRKKKVRVRYGVPTGENETLVMGKMPAVVTERLVAAGPKIVMGRLVR